MAPGERTSFFVLRFQSDASSMDYTMPAFSSIAFCTTFKPIMYISSGAGGRWERNCQSSVPGWVYAEVLCKGSSGLLEVATSTYHEGGSKSTSHVLKQRISRTNALFERVRWFIFKVGEEEQPYVKVRDMVLSQQRRANLLGTFTVDNSAVQMGFHLKGVNLFLSLRWESLWDWHLIAKSESIDQASRNKLWQHILNLIPQIHTSCTKVIEECHAANLGKYEVEARIRRAQFFALHRIETFAQMKAGIESVIENQGSYNSSCWGETGLREGKQSLDTCDQLCLALPGTVGPLKAKINEAGKLLEGEAFYVPLSQKEKEDVYLAMSAEFSSTGRWYTCQNGHPVSNPAQYLSF
ncbi:hypothetical protein BDZ91DRAFT_814928 [Kalaharituber pfeilii]|nr:hypothetical protein BDZ91DRAFT_814928 [Kalaharituber pfeilii]